MITIEKRHIRVTVYLSILVRLHFLLHTIIVPRHSVTLDNGANRFFVMPYLENWDQKKWYLHSCITVPTSRFWVHLKVQSDESVSLLVDRLSPCDGAYVAPWMWVLDLARLRQIWLNLENDTHLILGHSALRRGLLRSRPGEWSRCFRNCIFERTCPRCSHSTAAVLPLWNNVDEIFSLCTSWRRSFSLLKVCRLTCIQ